MSDIEKAIQLIKIRDDVDRSKSQAERARHHAHLCLDQLQSRPNPLHVPNQHVQGALDEAISAMDHACAMLDKLQHEYSAAKSRVRKLRS